jgi:hypothetical protein
VRAPIRPAGTAVAVAILTLGLAPSAGAVSTIATGADHATVASAPAGADAAARYWKCRWPSYRNAHPWRCRLHFEDSHRDRDRDRHDDGGRHHGGDGGGHDHGDDHGPGWSGAVTQHPKPGGGHDD